MTTHYYHKAMRVACAGLFMSLAWHNAFAADPETQKTAVITRNAQSELKAEAKLIDNAYRKEQKQVEYTVQVPYEEQEAYEVQVPYETQDEYEEQVPYEDTETYEEQVPYTESEAYEDTETYYENENQCTDVTHYRQECSQQQVCERQRDQEECHQEQVCERTRGSNDVSCHYENQCTTRRGDETCHYENQCQQVPYTDQECNVVSVPHTRSVTKYRDVTKYRSETRTRTVTKYRSETRCCQTVTHYRTETQYRTVTKYRDETRCCQTVDVDVFDHQWTVPVEVVFTEKLTGTETEQFTLTLSGTENAPAVDIETTKGIFKYQVKNAEMHGGIYSIEMQTLPKYKSTDLGDNLVSSILIQNLKEQTVARFNDTGLVPHVQSQYHIRVLNTQNELVAESTESAIDGVTVTMPLKKLLADHADYQIELSVNRSGDNLDKAMSFIKKDLFKGKPVVNTADLKDPKFLRDVQVTGVGHDMVILVGDTLQNIPGVDTQFTATLSRKSGLFGGSRTVMDSKTFSRVQLTKDTNGFYAIKVSRGFAISDKDMQKYLGKGYTLFIKLAVKRSFAEENFTGEFSKDYEIKIK